MPAPLQGTVSFQACFGDLVSSYSYSAQVSERAAVASLLSKARCLLARRAYDYAPIDCGKIEAYVKSTGITVSDPLALSKLVLSLSPSTLESGLKSSVSFSPVPDDDVRKQVVEGKKIGYAVGYYLYLAYARAFGEPVPEPAGSFDKKEVRLVANSPEWMVVKRANLSEWKKPEILSAIIGMLSTVLRKEAEYSCKAGLDFEAEAQKLFGGFFKRKSFGKLGEALTSVSPQAVAETAERLALDKSLALEVERLLYLKAFEYSGYSPCPGPGLLAETYPELKIPKPRGNYGGKKRS